jgi:hypothetical protein
LIDECTAAGTEQLTAAVRITHPFHPQRGEEIEVLVQRQQWGEDRVFYRSAQGHRASIPAAWTSLVPDDPFVVVAAGRSKFRVDDLLELVALVSRSLR